MLFVDPHQDITMPVDSLCLGRHVLDLLRDTHGSQACCQPMKEGGRPRVVIGAPYLRTPNKEAFRIYQGESI